MSYPVCENWKDLIDENTIAIFDADQCTYVCAATNEERSVKITNKKTNEEFICKNKTEFFGRKKTIIEGQLGDINILRSSKNLEPFTKEDFELEDIQTPNETHFVYHSIKSKLLADLEYLGLTKYKCFLGGKGNPRLDLEAPKQYKSSRKDLMRPLLLQEARDYILKHHNGTLVEGMECDDILTIYGYLGYLDYKKTGKFSYICVTFDKDQYSTPCLVFNNHKDGPKYRHPIPHLIDDSVGKVFKDDKSKVHGYGFKWLCHQMLYADPTDTALSYQCFDWIKFSEGKSYELLLPLTEKKECLQVVVDTYKSWFPEEFTFTSWTGKEITYNWLQWAESVFLMVYMKRLNNDTTTFEKLLKHFKVDY